MRYLLALLLGLALILPACAAEETAPPAGQDIVYAVTTMGKPPVTAIYVLEPKSGLRRLLYRDTDETNRVIMKMGGSDIVGAGRTVAPKDVFVVTGPAVAPESPARMDAISRLRVPDEAGKQAVPEQVLPLPLSFGETSAYHLWNRAPIFAVSADAAVFAVSVTRVGGKRLGKPAIRVISSAGGTEWSNVLPESDLYVSDLAFSADAKLLAYSVMPVGDEHTLDPSRLPLAGLYIADLTARTTRLLYPGFIDALAWGPKPEQITAAQRVGDIWSTTCSGAVVSVVTGLKLREFSLHGPAVALAYSGDAQWLAAETVERDQRVWVYPVAGGWGKQAPISTETGGRAALLGWLRMPPMAAAAAPGTQQPAM
jgi:hypothetical protein